MQSPGIVKYFWIKAHKIKELIIHFYLEYVEYQMLVNMKFILFKMIKYT